MQDVIGKIASTSHGKFAHKYGVITKTHYAVKYGKPVHKYTIKYADGQSTTVVTSKVHIVKHPDASMAA